MRLLLADDHDFYRRSLRRLCQQKGGCQVVGEAADGQQAVALALQLQPDLILMDFSMPLLDGIEATRQILAARPVTLILILSMYHEERLRSEARAAGARGYLLKDIDWPELLAAMRRVAAGQSLFDGDDLP